MNFRSEMNIGIIGLLSVIILITSLLVFGLYNHEFSFYNDYISRFGARGEPNAFLFNLIGFVAVGVFLFAFGLMYGNYLNDRFLSVLLSLFGLGFGFTAIPIDMELVDDAFTKAHIVTICLGLASWLFGLSRIAYNHEINKKLRNRANVTATLLVSAMIGAAFEIWSMPITHRLVFAIVFGWTSYTSIELLRITNPTKIDYE